FDPNGDDEASWRTWIESGLRTLVPRRAGWNYVCSRPERTDVTIIPLPWLWPSPGRYDLPDNHCLERVAIDLLSTAYEKYNLRVGRWIDELRADNVEVTWKVAARLWNALV